MGLWQSLSSRKREFGIILVLLTIGLFFVPRLVWVIQDMSMRTILYQSPADGEVIVIDDWIYGAVIVEPPPEGLMNFYAISAEVLAWNNCNSTLDLKYGMVPLTPAQYLELNSTEKDLTFGNEFRKIRQSHPYTGESSTSISSIGTHVWALKFVGSSVEVPAITLKVFITISLTYEIPLTP